MPETAMPNSADLALFVLASLVCILMPGPAVLYVLANGLGRGRRASVAAAWGTTAGVSVHLLAAVAGLAAVLHTSAVLFNGVKWAGAGYLVFLAWRTFRSRDEFLPAPSTRSVRGVRIFWTGFGVNILNPKLSVFFLAFLPQFVGAGAAQPALTMLVLGALFMAMTIVIFILYGLFAAELRGVVLARPRIADGVRWTLASLFLGLGIRLALAERG
jgi:threonine/homoserine/homoserine lactone efflux protein